VVGTADEGAEAVEVKCQALYAIAGAGTGADGGQKTHFGIVTTEGGKAITLGLGCDIATGVDKFCGPERIITGAILYGFEEETFPMALGGVLNYRSWRDSGH